MDETRDGLFKCDKCGFKGEPDEFGYIGPKDRENTGCSPFTEWEQLCKKCEEEREKP